MNSSRKRVREFFAREIPDRVPINYAGNEGINQRLLRHFGLENDPAGWLKLMKCLQVDFSGIGAPYTGPRLHPERPGKQVDPLWGWVTRWIEHPSGGYYDYCEFPLQDADEEQVAAYPLPNPDDFDYDAALNSCKQLQDDFALHVGNAGTACVINTNGFLRGMEQALVDIGSEDEIGIILTQRRMEVDLAIMERTIDKCKDYIDFLWLGEDLGTQIAPMISPKTYRNMIKPWHKKFVDLAKSYGLFVIVHTCGSSSWAYNDFIELGIDAVDTLQPEAADMSPDYLKRTYGDRLSFHGCISTAGPLAYGTPEEVVRNVRETLATMMPGGGYALSPTHSIQDNSPLENVLAMYEAALKYGKY